MTSRIPITILTGFLGSGKTTILNQVVTNPEFKSTAVIINEFGEVGIDHLLVETSTEKMIELNNGCICCTIRGDLADKLGSLAMWIDTGRVPPVERVIVETTGLADPVPIMHTLMTDDSLLARYRLERIVTVVDAIAGLASLEQFPEAVKQVAVADELILSKTDLVTELSDAESQARLNHEIRDVNPRARIHRSDRGEIDLQVLRERPEADPASVFADLTTWLAAAEPDSCDSSCANGHHHHDHDCGSSHRGIVSFVVSFEGIDDIVDFGRFLQELVIEFGGNILRLKGIVRVADRPDTPAVLQGVQHVLFPVSWLRGWYDDDRSSKLVFITHDVEPAVIKARFAAHLRLFGQPAANPAEKQHAWQ